jgi:hypothetical protein
LSLIFYFLKQEKKFGVRLVSPSLSMLYFLFFKTRKKIFGVKLVSLSLSMLCINLQLDAGVDYVEIL